MQAFVRLPTEFDDLLLNAAGYFDVSPKGPYPLGGLIANVLATVPCDKQITTKNDNLLVTCVRGLRIQNLRGTP